MQILQTLNFWMVVAVYSILGPHLLPREHTQFIQEFVVFSIQSTTFYWCFSGPVDGSIQWINHQTENLLLCLMKYLNPMTRCRRPSAYLMRDASWLTISSYKINTGIVFNVSLIQTWLHLKTYLIWVAAPV